MSRYVKSSFPKHNPQNWHWHCKLFFVFSFFSFLLSGTYLHMWMCAWICPNIFVDIYIYVCVDTYMFLYLYRCCTCSNIHLIATVICKQVATCVNKENISNNKEDCQDTQDMWVMWRILKVILWYYFLLN